MPLYLRINKCMNLHSDDTPSRFDPIKSDSNFPSLFCSIRCEREWVASWLANLKLADVFDIQARQRAPIGTQTSPRWPSM